MLVFVKLGIVVLGATLVLWLPFANDYKQVLHRIFPFYRGLFEDKVANIWCALSILIKWQRLFSQVTLVRARYIVIYLFTIDSTILTLVCSLPSNIHVLVRPEKRNFIYALICTSFAFFLCSFHVHEKTILFPLLPAILLVGLDDRLKYVTSMLIAVATFRYKFFVAINLHSMFPLIIKDQLQMAYFAMQFFFAIVFIRPYECTSIIQYYLWPVACILMSGMHILFAFVAAPAKYPDLYTYFAVIFSCFLFVMYTAYIYLLQFTQPKIKSK